MKDSQEDILAFWFEEASPQQWFAADPDFDAEIRRRFHDLYDKAQKGLCDAWQGNAEGCLALCILLDQFPRNMFRGLPAAFATDGKALAVARHAVAQGFDKEMPPIRRRFIYLPYEHSEDIADQRLSVSLFGTMQADDPLGYDYAVKHLEVIEAFGRFPHRNDILGRESTPQEKEYMAQPGAGF